MKMVNREIPYQRTAHRDVRFHGIKRHARELGVSHPHLWRVLIGERVSPGLLARYRHLVKAEAKQSGVSAKKV